MTTIASQITWLTIVYSTVYSDADQRKHQSSTSLAFVSGIHRDLWIPHTKGQLRGKCFHLMTSSCTTDWSPWTQCKWIHNLTNLIWGLKNPVTKTLNHSHRSISQKHMATTSSKLIHLLALPSYVFVHSTIPVHENIHLSSHKNSRSSVALPCCLWQL